MKQLDDIALITKHLRCFKKSTETPSVFWERRIAKGETTHWESLPYCESIKIISC